jgi:YHS domain-containing protein
MKLFAFLGLVFIMFSGKLSAQVSKRQEAYNLFSKQVAIDGYDAVAYFIHGKAVEGKAFYAVSHEGITYHFSSQENKAKFLVQPAKYEPQYGGWCAYAMGATGEKVPVDPETFKIVNGKLFLFYNKFFNNTLKSWNKDEKALNTRADTNWANLFNKQS